MTRVIQKIKARVFCRLKGGGNPVSIFATEHGLTSATQQRLAQSCDWESVVVNRRDRQLSFFMPTGEEVSFCAHAAIGGAMQLAPTKQTTDTLVDFSPAHKPDAVYHATLHEHDIVSLQMTTPWIETAIEYPPTLIRILLRCLGLEPSDMSSKSVLTRGKIPTFCNSSVARPKTLVHLSSLDALHRAKAPPVSNDYFSGACDAIDSTGIYLYTDLPPEDDPDNHDASSPRTMSFACRQFPRASGYPEDPATGIAAAALAASLEHQLLFGEIGRNQQQTRRYKFYQGAAMGQTSLIMVEDLQWKSTENVNGEEKSEGKEVSFRLVGRVEIDEQESIEVEDKALIEN